MDTGHTHIHCSKVSHVLSNYTYCKIRASFVLHSNKVFMKEFIYSPVITPSFATTFGKTLCTQ